MYRILLQDPKEKTQGPKGANERKQRLIWPIVLLLVLYILYLIFTFIPIFTWSISMVIRLRWYTGETGSQLITRSIATHPVTVTNLLSKKSGSASIGSCFWDTLALASICSRRCVSSGIDAISPPIISLGLLSTDHTLHYYYYYSCTASMDFDWPRATCCFHSSLLSNQRLHRLSPSQAVLAVEYVGKRSTVLRFPFPLSPFQYSWSHQPKRSSKEPPTATRMR